MHAATRLGWTRNRGAYVPLGAVRPDGGTVPRTLVVIQRRLQVRPVVYCQNWVVRIALRQLMIFSSACGSRDVPMLTYRHAGEPSGQVLNHAYDAPGCKLPARPFRQVARGDRAMLPRTTFPF